MTGKKANMLSLKHASKAFPFKKESGQPPTKEYFSFLKDKVFPVVDKIKLEKSIKHAYFYPKADRSGISIIFEINDDKNLPAIKTILNTNGFSFDGNRSPEHKERVELIELLNVVIKKIIEDPPSDKSEINFNIQSIHYQNLLLGLDPIVEASINIQEGHYHLSKAYKINSKESAKFQIKKWLDKL